MFLGLVGFFFKICSVRFAAKIKIGINGEFYSQPLTNLISFAGLSEFLVGVDFWFVQGLVGLVGLWREWLCRAMMSSLSPLTTPSSAPTTWYVSSL